MSADPAEQAGVERSDPREPEAAPADTHGEIWVAPDEPLGIEPTLRAIQRAIEQVELALEAAGDARTTLVELGSGSPGDDLVLLGFLRSQLIPAEQRLLSTLAGLSDEHRALLRSSTELGLIYTRPFHDPAPALARLAATTAAIRKSGIASYVAPRPSAASATDRRIDRQLDGLLPVERHPARPASDGISVALGRLGGLFRSRPGEREAQPDLHPAASKRPTGLSGIIEPEGSVTAAVELAEPVDGETIDELAPLALEQPFTKAVAVVDEVTDEHEDADDQDGGSGGSAAASAAAVTATDLPRGGRSAGVRPRSGSRPRSSRRVGGAAIAIAFVIVGISALSGFRPGADAASEPDASSAAVAGASDVPVDAPIVPVGDDHPTPVPSATPLAATPAATTPVNATVATVIDRGPAARKVVALTFDDGYAPVNVRSILEILVTEKVKATFFINGYYLSRDPQLWREVAAAGFPVGNHTYYHRDVRLLTDEEIATELRMTENAWRRVTGGELIPYFRPPYGSHDARTDAAVAARGYPTVVMWDTSNGDTKKGVTTKASIAAGTKGENGSIVLLHAGPDITPRVLGAIIASYRARGFEFVTIPELLGGQAGV